MALAGCAQRPAALGGVSATVSPVSITRDQLVGSWGVAAYHEERDRGRVEGMARSLCTLPYRIKRGPTDGVIMHVADDATPHELRLKAGPGGATYLGFEAPAGDVQDRQIVFASANRFGMRFVDKETNKRYGTFVYMRCI